MRVAFPVISSALERPKRLSPAATTEYGRRDWYSAEITLAGLKYRLSSGRYLRETSQTRLPSPSITPERIPPHNRTKSHLCSSAASLESARIWIPIWAQSARNAWCHHRTPAPCPLGSRISSCIQFRRIHSGWPRTASSAASPAKTSCRSPTSGEVEESARAARTRKRGARLCCGNCKKRRAHK